MGSAAGALAASRSFWERGYRHGFASDNTEAPSLDTCMWNGYAHTVSRSRAGLYRAGYENGIADRMAGRAHGSTRYDDYRAVKDAAKPRKVR